MTKINTAMVLAAGLGTRMRHLSETLPKPLIPLGGRALIDHGLDRLAASGIERVVVNVHYMADAVEHHLRARQTPHVVISDERDLLLDTGGGVKRALHHFGNEPFVIHNSDSVWIEAGIRNVAALLAQWNDEAMDALMLLARREASLGYHGTGDFHMSATGALTRKVSGETAPYVFAGVSVAHPRLFEDCPDGRFSLNMLWDKALAAGRVFGVEHRGLWMHVGTPEALASAEAAMSSAGAIAI